MLRYPRIEVIKRIIYVPIYRESYEVQTMRPNRPMQSKFGMSKTQANAYSKRMLALLKKEGYDKAVFNSSMVDLRKFVLWSLCAPIWLYGGVFFGGAYRPTPLVVLSSTSICFWIEPIQLLLASLSSLDDVFADESDVLSGMAETISHSPCSIWIYFLFPILLYILILLLTYSNIVV